MKKVKNELEILSYFNSFKDKVVIDVGCGTGEIVRELTSRGARVTGLDTQEMIRKAKDVSKVGDETYLTGGGENLPFEDNYTDIIIFFASLHHVLEGMLNQALKEAHRVLKPGGTVFCLEPVGQKGSYFEILSLLEDERDSQVKAYEAIKNAKIIGLVNKEEYIVYIERSYEDYIKLMNVFVEDKTKRNECLARAKEITERFSRESGVDFKDFRFKSVCRVNILKKV